MILLLNISIDMPASQNHSSYAFRFGLRRLATMPTAKPGIIQFITYPASSNQYPGSFYCLKPILRLLNHLVKKGNAEAIELYSRNRVTGKIK